MALPPSLSGGSFSGEREGALLDVAASYPIPRQSSVPGVSSVLGPIPTVSVELPLASGFCGDAEAVWRGASGCVPLQVPNLSGLLVLVSS